MLQPKVGDFLYYIFPREEDFLRMIYFAETQKNIGNDQEFEYGVNAYTLFYGIVIGVNKGEIILSASPYTDAPNHLKSSPESSLCYNNFSNIFVINRGAENNRRLIKEPFLFNNLEDTKARMDALKDELKTMMDTNKWYVYAVRCQDESLYCGIAKDIDKRVEQHNDGKGAKYIVASRRPVEVVYREGPMLKSDALKREATIKSFSKEDKEKMVELYNEIISKNKDKGIKIDEQISG